MVSTMLSADLIGIEIGGTKLQVVLGNAQGEIAETLEAAADAAGGGPAILQQIEALVEQLLATSDAPVRGIGVGFGGPVDAATGVVIKSNHVEQWENVSLVDWASEKFSLPCVVGNDTDLAAVAEARVGAGRGDRCVFYTNIGSGIGGGLVVDGQLYARPGGAMEVGHNRIYSELEGRWGILEDFCSGWSLDRRAQAAAEQFPDSTLRQLAGHDVRQASAVTLFDAWQQGDEAATRLVNCFLDCYGRTLSNVIALVNPDVVIIGGGVAQRGSTLLEAIRQRVRQEVYEPFRDSYRIELTELGKSAVPVVALVAAADLQGSAAEA